MLKDYTYNPSVPSNYKVASLYKDGHISTTNHRTIRDACEGMRLLGVSFHNHPTNKLNIWIEEW